MTTALSTELATEQAVAQHAEDAFLVLLTLEHPDVSPTPRFVRNRVAVTSRGNEFRASHFEIELPNDAGDVPQARLTVSNVDRRIGQALQALVTPPTCLIELVLASTPDTVERAWGQFQLIEATWDAMTVQGVLSRITYWDEPFPYIRCTPKRFPGLFP